MLPVYRASLIVMAMLSFVGTLSFFVVPHVSDSAPICLVLCVGFLALTNPAPRD